MKGGKEEGREEGREGEGRKERLKNLNTSKIYTQ